MQPDLQDRYVWLCGYDVGGQKGDGQVQSGEVKGLQWGSRDTNQG